MKTLQISLLTSLTLAMGAQAWAQSPSAAPAPEARQSQASASLSNRERIELCRKKRGVPLEPAESQSQHLKESEGSITRPTPIYRVTPYFQHSHGTVAIEAVIDEDGCVRRARVLQSKTADRRLDDAAIKAFEQWVFLPATKDGRPVQVYYVMTINMSTKNE